MTRYLPAVILLAVCVGAAQAPNGYRYTFTVQGDGMDPVSGTTEALGSRSRIDMDGRSDPQIVLVDNAAHTVTMLYPDRREYSVVADTTFQRLVGTVLSSLPVVSIHLSDTDVSDSTLGPGETVAGHPTWRYQVRQAFTVNVSAFGYQAVGMRQRVTTQYWMARDLSLPANPLVTLLSQIMTVLAQSDREFAHRSAEALRPVARGTPLRIVIHSETRSGDKNDMESKTQTVQVVSIGRAAIDPHRFDIPAGYTRKDPEINGKMF